MPVTPYRLPSRQGEGEKSQSYAITVRQISLIHLVPFTSYARSIAVTTVISGFDTSDYWVILFSIVFTHYPRLNAAIDKRSFASRLNCNNCYYDIYGKLVRLLFLPYGIYIESLFIIHSSFTICALLEPRFTAILKSFRLPYRPCQCVLIRNPWNLRMRTFQMK